MINLIKIVIVILAWGIAISTMLVSCNSIVLDNTETFAAHDCDMLRELFDDTDYKRKCRLFGE